LIKKKKTTIPKNMLKNILFDKANLIKRKETVKNPEFGICSGM
jgi:hypothetical protein